MTFPTNNLPTQSKFWGREVEKKITNLESSLRSSEINNTTRDSQLSVTAGQALIAANQAQSAIDSIIDLSAPGGPAINAANITAGTISADIISGGTIDASDIVGVNITGANILTRSSGTRIDLSGSNIEFFSSLYASGANRVGYIQGDDGGDAGIYIISDQGSIALDAVDITLAGDTTVTGELSVGGSFSPASISTGAINSSSDITASGTISGSTISGSSVSVSGTVSGSTLSGGSISNSGNYTGNGFPTIRDNTVSGTTTFAPNVFISASTGNMARNTTMSERRAKENIQELDFDTDSFISINPVTFNYKREAVSDDEQAEAVNLGFILDDFEDVGLDEFLVAEPFEGDEYKQLRYNLLYMYLHKVVQKQQETIQDLNARIEALESR